MAVTVVANDARANEKLLGRDRSEGNRPRGDEVAVDEDRGGAGVGVGREGNVHPCVAPIGRVTRIVEATAVRGDAFDTQPRHAVPKHKVKRRARHICKPSVK